MTKPNRSASSRKLARSPIAQAVHDILRKRTLAHAMGAAAIALAPTSSSFADPKVWVNGAAFQPSIPTPNLPTPNLSGPWLQAGQATATSQGQLLLVDQTTGKVILNWSNFDIGEGYEVRFVQPDGTSIALNRVDANANPSHILGDLNANGGVYIINPNGVLFGPNAQVNVGSLLASSLDVTDDALFMNSTIKQAINQGQGMAALAADPQAAEGRTLLRTGAAPGAPEYVSAAEGEVGDVLVMPGAEIRSRTLDGVVAVGANVRNDGAIETPDGQALLAASKDEVYLAFSNDPKLRGLLVEVNEGGQVVNGPDGQISAPRGNVTLMGLAVNQQGRVSATTTVDFNGSVRLVARDTLRRGNPSGSLAPVSLLVDQGPQTAGGATASNGNIRIAQRGGEVTVGSGSVTEVTPELDSAAKAPDVQPQQPSSIELFGGSVHLEQNARVAAQGGRVFAEATANPSTLFQGVDYQAYVNQQSTIVLEEGAVIDVSGVDVALPMERNVIEVELRGNELADSPLQRDGLLDGARVRVDVRTGTPIANIDAAIEAVPRTVGERLIEGGTVQLRAEGSVVQRPGSVIDVSGGVVHYESGYIDTSMLVSGGRVYEIGSADPNRIYSGVLGQASRTFERWGVTETYQSAYSGRHGRHEEAYDHGAGAGEIVIRSQAASLEGEQRADVVVGPYQRDPRSAGAPGGGSLSVSLNLQGVEITPLEMLSIDPEDLLEENPLLAGAARNPLGLEADPLRLSPDFFRSSGFQSYSIESRNHGIVVAADAPLELAPGRSLELTAGGALDVQGSIRTAGGDVSLMTQRADANFIGVANVALNNAISLAPEATIDASGLWINDNPLRLPALGLDRPRTPIWIDGGAISMAAEGDLLLGAGSVLDASGGAWLDGDADLHAGVGGDIALSAVVRDPQAPRVAEVALGGEMRSHAFERGGELSVTAPSIRLTGDAEASSTEPSSTLVLHDEFFARGGFSAYSLTASAEEATNDPVASSFTIAGDADIRPRMQNFDWRADLAGDGLFAQARSDDSLHNLVTRVERPDYERSPVSLAFALENSVADPASLPDGREPVFTMETGASITTDPRASVSLATNTSLYVDGAVKAAAGEIRLELNDTEASETFHAANLDDVAVWLGPNARLSARSAFVADQPDPLGLRRGLALDAGEISIDVNRGFIIADEGAVLDVSADTYTIDAFRPASRGTVGGYHEQQLASDAGRIALTTAEGVLFNGEFRADADLEAGAHGGELAVTLDSNRRRLPSVPSPGSSDPFIDFDFSSISLGNREIVLGHGLSAPVVTDLAERLGAVDAIPDALNGAAVFDVDQLAGAGFQRYDFSALNTTGLSGQSSNSSSESIAVVNGVASVGRIVFEGDVALTAQESIALDAPTIVAQQGRAIVAAPYLSLGSSAHAGSDALTSTLQTSAAVSGGSGELIFLGVNPGALAEAGAAQDLTSVETSQLLSALNATDAGGLVDLQGAVSTRGADEVTIGSAGDIRTRGVLRGVGDDARFTGRFETFGDLTLQADQIYPSTLSEFVLSAGQRRVQRFEVFNPETNAVEMETPTHNEIYDYLAGETGVGDTIARLLDDRDTPDLSDDVYVNKEIRGVVETRLGAEDAQLSIRAGDGDSPVLSAAGSLILDAPSIDQAGVLKAPLGRLVFNAHPNPGGADAGSVVFRPGSITSTSAAGQIIPFGEIDGAGEWVYRPDASSPVVGLQLLEETPQKTVRVNAPSIDLQEGSTIDLSGGGDLQAYQFTPGPGGSRDVLSLEHSGESFAIVPALDPAHAPYDSNAYRDTNAISGDTFTFDHRPGDSVYLSGVEGLPAGEYAILPPRYAMLPGAFLITPVAGHENIQPGAQMQRLDGTPVVAGRYTTANSAVRDSMWSGFAVESVGMVRTRSEYDISLASSFFGSEDRDVRASIPGDAGALVLAAQRDLNLETTVRSSTGEQGRGARLDIVADDLAVVASEDPESNAVQILDSQISEINVESVLIGGRRRSGVDGERLAIDARQVAVGEGAELSAATIMLAARERVEVREGAQVTASGEVAGSGAALSFSGDGALLRVSAGEQAEFTHAAAAGVAGDLLLAENARASAADGSMLFFATRDTDVDGELAMSGGSLNIGAGLVSLGEVGDIDEGLVLTNDELSALDVDELILTSSTSIDVYGDLNLEVEDLSLNARGLRGMGASGEVASLSAHDRLLLSGFAPVAGDAAPAFGGAGAGALDLSAGRLVLGAGEFGVAGFEQVHLAGSEAVFGDGAGRFSISQASSVTLQTPLITGTGAAQTQLQTDGLLSVTASPAPAGASDDELRAGLGARFTLVGEELHFATRADLRSGRLELEARGAEGQDLIVDAGAAIDVSGAGVRFDGVSAASNGGAVGLRSASGDVLVREGSQINVSGVSGADGSDAGGVSIAALQGQAALNGELRASAGDDSHGGSFSLSVGRLDDFAAINREVQAGNFTESFDMRVAEGNLALGAADAISARSVSLTADRGSVTVRGSIDAVDEASINAGADVAVLAGGRIVADAEGDADDGGRVSLGAVAGTLTIAEGAVIDVSGGASGLGGEVHLRAPRTQGGAPLGAADVGDGVAIAALATDAIRGARRIDVEAFKVYEGVMQIDAAFMGAVNADAHAFMAHAPALEANLFGAFERDDIFHLQPGVEVRSTGDLTVAEGVDFGAGLGGEFNIFEATEPTETGGLRHQELSGSVWRFNETLARRTFNLFGSEFVFDYFSGGEAGFLTLRAAGDLNVNASISDGFASEFSLASFTAQSTLKDETAGWTYRMVGGADHSSADVMATGGAGGDVQFAPGVTVRASTGDVEIAAGGDLVLGEEATLYTAGRDTGAGSFDEWMRLVGVDTLDATFIAGAVYPIDGGDIRIRAGGDIDGNGSAQFFTDWLQRIGDFGASDPGSANNNTIASVINGYVPTTWAVVADDFRQNVAALGGGDVQIEAGDDVRDLSVSIPTTGQQTGAFTPDEGNPGRVTFTTNAVLVQGGGDLSVRAGGDIQSGRFLVGRGEARIEAGGDIAASDAPGAQDLLLALGEGNVDVYAGGSVSLAGVVNPTMLQMSSLQQGSMSQIPLRDMQSLFFTYSPESAASITALSGDVRLANDVSVAREPVPGVDVGGVDGFTNIYPGSISATALQSSINLSGEMHLFPSAQGGLSLLAAQNVVGSLASAVNVSDADPASLPGAAGPLRDLEAGPGVVNAITQRFSTRLTASSPTVDKLAFHAQTPVHLDNPEPITVVARDGDIRGVRLIAPKRVEITAGRDIENVVFDVQHVNESDVSVVRAGRDVVFDTPRQGNNQLGGATVTGVEVAGPGRLDLVAGRHIALGASRGVQSIGNAKNPNLLSTLGYGPEDGASLSLIAGMREDPDYDAFIEQYFAEFDAPAAADTTEELIALSLSEEYEDALVERVSDVTGVDYETQFDEPVAAARAAMEGLPWTVQQQIAFRVTSARSENYAGDLIEYVASERFAGEWLPHLEQATGASGLNRDEALALMRTLSLEQQHAIALASFNASSRTAQRGLVLPAYFNEVRQGGVEDLTGDPSSVDEGVLYGLERSFTAIETLFPNQDSMDGDVSLVFSTIQTQQGGDISVTAPGGGVDVGLAGNASAISKDPSQLGIIALRAGHVNAVVADDINVNRARVFALDGGDIMLWSSDGDIDAGRGAKSALSIPPPTINENGSIDFQAAVAGSGIRNSRFTADRAPGSVFLFAPQGVVDAGDAGIGSAGDVIIGAQEIIGADNIDIGGIAVGLPVDTGGLAASLTGVSAAASSATKAAAESGESVGEGEPAATTLAETALSWLDVFVVGLGEDACRPDDLECLKRQDRDE